jgi:hypothetical protein
MFEIIGMSLGGYYFIYYCVWDDETGMPDLSSCNYSVWYPLGWSE